MRLPFSGVRKLFFFLAIVCLWVTAAGAATKHVNIGNFFFQDVASGTSTTTINAGDTVEWDWQVGFHSTTSGSCTGANCSPNGIWDAGQHSAPNSFSRTFSTPGTFTYFCTVHLSAMQGTVIVNAPPPPPDFTLSIPNLNGGQVFPNSPAVFNGSIAPLNGFTSSVTMSCQAGANTPPSCAPSPASAPPPFSFQYAASAPAVGHYDFAAQGTGGGITHSVSGLNFDVVSYNMAVSPTLLTGFSDPVPAVSTSSSITLTAAGIFSGTVTLSCSGLPTGAVCNFTPAGPYPLTANTPVSVNMTITVPPDTAAQDYAPHLMASSTVGQGTSNFDQPLILRVVQFAASAFSPGTVTIGAGSTPNVSDPATTQLTASPNFTNPASASLACTAGLPAGGACNFAPATVIGTFPSSASVTVSVPANTASGNSALTITVTASLNGASTNRTLPLTLSVPPPGFSFGAPSPATVNMVNNSFSPPVTVQVRPVNFAGLVTLSCKNLPVGVSCIFAPATTVNVSGQPLNVAVVFEANGTATPATLNNITINGAATINGTPVSASIGLTQLNISAPGSSTTIASTLAAVNLVTNSALTNVGDPNLAITTTVNNTGSTYSAAVWEVNFSRPVSLVAASNAQCTQVTSTAVSCAIGDIPVGSGNSYSFKVAPAFARTIAVNSLLTSPTVGSNSLAGNSAAATVQVRPRPLARKGLVPKVP